MRRSSAFGYNRAMGKQLTDEMRAKANAECLKRSKFGSCRMECETDKTPGGYCREVLEKAAK